MLAASDFDALLRDAVEYAAGCARRGERVLLQPMYRMILWKLRSRLGAIRLPDNDEGRALRYKQLNPFIRDSLVPLCSRVYKQPTCQLREEMQRWERNGFMRTGTLGKGVKYWSDKIPPMTFAAVPAKGKPWANKNLALGNAERERGRRARIITEGT